MWIKRLEYNSDSDYRGKIVFNKKTIIESEHNAVGKSTLLRVILYALGFEVVMTNGIADLNLKTTIQVVIDNLKEIQIYRDNEEVVLTWFSNGTIEKKQEMHLPEDREKMQSLFLNFKNSKILDNCLGTFYFEQGRGYSLINHGVVTPKNYFDLRKLILQLVPEIEEKIQELNKKENIVKRRIVALKAINDVLKDGNGYLEENDEDEITIQNVNSLKFKLRQLNRRKKEVKKSINDNDKLLEFIGKLKLKLKLSDGTRVLVAPEKIEGMESVSNYLKSEKLVLNNQIEETKELIYKNEQSLKKKYKNQVLDKFAIPKAFNVDKNEATLRYLQKQTNNFSIQKKDLLKKHSYQELQNRLYKLYTNNANELKVYNWLSHGIFSSKNISGLIGTEQEFTAVSIRLAALKLIEESTKINLPLIFDSPFQELDSNNSKLLIKFLENEFSEKHQIIVTSVAKEIPQNLDNWQFISLE